MNVFALNILGINIIKINRFLINKKRMLATKGCAASPTSTTVDASFTSSSGIGFLMKVRDTMVFES